MITRKLKIVLKVILWTWSISIVLGIGIYYFPKECEGLSFWGALYYTIRLFILEHDLGFFPKSFPLIFIYYFAPMIALSAAGTVISYFFQMSPALRTRWKSDHIVICGVGRTGKVLAATFKKKGISVVGVDSGSPDTFEEWCMESRVPMIYGDFLSQVVLEKAGAERARAVIFASGDDLLNLEGAISAYGWLRSETGPVRTLWAHISNEKLADTAQIAIRTRGSVEIRFFDTYYIAASKMVSKFFPRESRQDVKEIYILGFGKFGRDLMEVLIRDFRPGFERAIRVVDIRDQEKEVRSLAEEFEVSNRVTFQQADIRELRLYDDMDKAFFLCTDDDIGNLAIALMLTSHAVGNYIYVRMARWPMPAMEEHLRESRGITFVNINDLVTEGIEDLLMVFNSTTYGR